MLTTILAAALFITGGGLVLFGLFVDAVAAINWDYSWDFSAKKVQTYVSRVAFTTGAVLIAVAVVWGITAQAF